ncbi:MAG: CsbD family protein [Myxococcota bacterium]
MNWDRIKGNWNQFKGNIKQNFGQLTDDDIMQINGQQDVLLGRLQQRYGYTKDVAQQKLNDFLNNIKEPQKV